MPNEQPRPDAGEGEAQAARSQPVKPEEPTGTPSARPPPLAPELEDVYFDEGSVETAPVAPLRLFDAEPGRERVRAAVALILVALLAVMVIVSLVAAIVDEGAGGRMMNILDTLLPPVAALCGSAIGFYYAGRPNQ